MRTVTIALALLAAACGSQPKPLDPGHASKTDVYWRTLGSWSGRGNTQTPSFTSESGSLRLRWETRVVNPVNNANPGTFRLTAHSAISGRPIKLAVDEHGVGQGTAYVDDDPHVFYMVVESANLDWAFTVDEAFAGTASASDPSGKH